MFSWGCWQKAALLIAYFVFPPALKEKKTVVDCISPRERVVPPSPTQHDMIKKITITSSLNRQQRFRTARPPSS